jgi:hypothetical protein
MKRRKTERWFTTNNYDLCSRCRRCINVKKYVHLSVKIVALFQERKRALPGGNTALLVGVFGTCWLLRLIHTRVRAKFWHIFTVRCSLVAKLKPWKSGALPFLLIVHIWFYVSRFLVLGEHTLYYMAAGSSRTRLPFLLGPKIPSWDVLVSTLICLLRDTKATRDGL